MYPILTGYLGDGLLPFDHLQCHPGLKGRFILAILPYLLVCYGRPFLTLLPCPVFGEHFRSCGFRPKWIAILGVSPYNMTRRSLLRKRRTDDDNFKARVALEAIKGERTISEIAGQFEVHPNRIIKWEKKLLENIPSLFSKKEDPEIEELKKLIEELYKKIGQQNIELEFLKKKYKQLQSL